MENLRVLEGSEAFFRGLQHLYHQFKSGWRLLLKKHPEYLFPGAFCQRIQEKLPVAASRILFRYN